MDPAELLRRERVYERAVRLARPLLRLASPLNGKLARGVRGREGAAERLEAWAAASREPGRPLVWLHAPSVGEGLMAQAIIAALRARAPEAQVAFTFFSPSAERLRGATGADVEDYLPWDLDEEVGRAVAALRPDVVAFVRTEVWPVLTAHARAAGARLALVNAILPRRAGRLRWAARFLTGPAFYRLDGVGAVSEADARRFPLLGVPSARVRVTGDARFDQVWQRVRALRPDAPLLSRLRAPGGRTVVAGSTWPSDERLLVPAVAGAREGEVGGEGGGQGEGERPGGRVRLIVAPHEPTEAHLRGVERLLDAHGIGCRRLGRVAREGGIAGSQGRGEGKGKGKGEGEGEGGGEGDLEAIVVDRVGVLADLYAIADVAYVGGGFHEAGLHSVVEPAALGVPVLFGPRHDRSREAGELAAAGGGVIVPDGAALERALGWWLTDGEARERAGAAAEAYVRSQLGGAEGNAALILELAARG